MKAVKSNIHKKCIGVETSDGNEQLEELERVELKTRLHPIR